MFLRGFRWKFRDIATVLHWTTRDSSLDYAVARIGMNQPFLDENLLTTTGKIIVLRNVRVTLSTTRLVTKKCMIYLSFFQVMSYFPNGKSTICGTDSEYVLEPLKQIQVYGNHDWYPPASSNVASWEMAYKWRFRKWFINGGFNGKIIYKLRDRPLLCLIPGW